MATETTGKWLAAEYVAAQDSYRRQLAMEWLIEDVPDAHERTLLLEEALKERDEDQRRIQAARLASLGWVDSK